MSELPEGWIETTFEKVADIQLGKMLDKNKNVGEPVPYLRNINVRWGGFDLDDVFSMKMSSEERQKYSIQSGDLIVCEGGEPGRAAIWREQECQFAFQKALMRVRSNGAAMPDWMHALLIYASASGDLSERFTGTTIKHLPQRALASTPIPLPPLAEQRRIVEKLDSLTGQRREVAAALSRVETLIARYKAAVLARAFSGQLTKDLRDDSSNGQFSELLGMLPAGWHQATLGDIADIQTGLQVGKQRNKEEKLQQYPYLRVANVQRGWLDLSEIKHLGATDAEFRKLVLQSGDILMNEGGDRDKLGRGWVWKNEIPNCIHQNHVYRVRLKTDQVSPEYVSMFTNEFGRNYFFDQGQQTTNLASISKTKLSGVPIPIPSRAEAFEIVARIEVAFAQIETLKRAVTAARSRLGSLDRSVLAKAFRGELVPQDPNDEPASELLRRVQQNPVAS